MSVTQFNRDSMARWYARAHLNTDPGVKEIIYLPKNAGEREIRFVEINCLFGDSSDAVLEPIDFGIDTGMESAHRLFVLDVTPNQWERIKAGDLPLPSNWSLKDAVRYPHE